MTIARSDDLLPEHIVLAYHERTKHHSFRYAASLGYLDWANQPNPFRRYEEAPLVRLPLPDAGRTPQYWQLYAIYDIVPAPLSVNSISLFFRYALSLTAWKFVAWIRRPIASGLTAPVGLLPTRYGPSPKKMSTSLAE